MATLTADFDVATADRYYSVPSDAKPDGISGEAGQKLE